MYYFIVFILGQRMPPGSTLFPYTTLFRSKQRGKHLLSHRDKEPENHDGCCLKTQAVAQSADGNRDGDDADKQFALPPIDRKSTRLNSSHSSTSYAVFCLKKKKYADRRLSV